MLFAGDRFVGSIDSVFDRDFAPGIFVAVRGWRGEWGSRGFLLQTNGDSWSWRYDSTPLFLVCPD